MKGTLIFILTALVTAGMVVPAGAAAGQAGTPATVTLAGDFQSELGSPGDWQPDSPVSRLTYDASDDVWQGTFLIPAGSWQYKAAIDGSWDENYGAHAVLNGASLQLDLAMPTVVKFYYDHKSHWVTDNVNSVIAVAAGDFQSELGCPGDWQPDCLCTWLQDIDGDGVYRFVAEGLPPGTYQAKVALDESWTVNYGAGGVADGENMVFEVRSLFTRTAFLYDSSTHQTVIGPTTDVNRDGVVDAIDVQLTINAVLSYDISPWDADVDGDGAPDAIDLQYVINTVLGVI